MKIITIILLLIKKFLENFLKRRKEQKKQLFLYNKWLKYEVEWELKGDTRCEFEKLVDECRIRKLNVMISNPGKCSNSDHHSTH